MHLGDYIKSGAWPSQAGRRRVTTSIAVMASLVFMSTALAARFNGPGVTDTEIKLGQTMPYSGPASAFATIGKAQLAFFEKLNAEGGINGRRVKLISVDDAFSPPKTVEQIRKLVEGDEVLALFNALGPGQMAVMKYVNSNVSSNLNLSQ